MKYIADRMDQPITFCIISHFHQTINYTLLSPHLSWTLLQLCYLGPLRDNISLGSLLLFRDTFRVLPILASLDDILWTTPSLLSLSPDVLWYRGIQYDH